MSTPFRLLIIAYWLILWILILWGFFSEKNKWEVEDIIFVAVWPLFGAAGGVILTGLLHLRILVGDHGRFPTLGMVGI